MNSSSSSLDPRVPSIQRNIQTIFSILAGLSLKAADIKFAMPNTLLGSGSTQNSDGTYQTVVSQLQNEQIPDQEISTLKVIGLDDLINLLKSRVSNIEGNFPLIVEYNEYNEADNTWTTTTKILSNVSSAYTFIFETIPKICKYTKTVFDLLGITSNAKKYVELIDEVDDAVENIATNTKNIATQATEFTALETQVEALEVQIQTESGRVTVLEAKETALEVRTGATETGLAANDAHDVVQDGLIEAQTAAIAASEAAQAAALAAAVGGLEAEIAAVAAGAALGAALAGIFGLAKGTGSNGETTYTINNPAFDPTTINNNIVALQTDNMANKTFLNAMIANNYITFSGGSYTLTDSFKNLASNLMASMSSILDIYTKFVNAGFFTATTNNGITTYSPTMAFTNLLTVVSTNTSNIATNTSNISTNTTNIATNTSNISTNTTNITALQNIEKLEANVFAQTGLATPTYDGNGNPTNYTVASFAKNLVTNYYYGIGLTLYGSDYLPPYHEQIYAYWQARNFRTLQVTGTVFPDGNTNGKSVQNNSYVANWYQTKGYSGNLLTLASGTGLPRLLNDGTSGPSAGSPTAYEVYTGNGGLLSNNLKLNDYSIGVSGGYTMWVLFRSFVDNVNLGNTGCAIMGVDSGSSGVGLYLNQYGIYSGVGTGAFYAVRSAGTNIGANTTPVFSNQKYYFVTLSYGINDANSTQYYNYSGPSPGNVNATLAGTTPIGAGFKVAITVNGKLCGQSASYGPSINSSVFGLGCQSNTNNNYTTNCALVSYVAAGIHQIDMSAGAPLSNMFAWIKSQHPNITFTDPY